MALPPHAGHAATFLLLNLTSSSCLSSRMIEASILEGSQPFGQAWFWPPSEAQALRSNGGEGLHPAGDVCGCLRKIVHSKQSRYAQGRPKFLESFLKRSFAMLRAVW